MLKPAPAPNSVLPVFRGSGCRVRPTKFNNALQTSSKTASFWGTQSPTCALEMRAPLLQSGHWETWGSHHSVAEDSSYVFCDMSRCGWVRRSWLPDPSKCREPSPNTGVTSHKTWTVSLTNFRKIHNVKLNVVPERCVFFILFAFSINEELNDLYPSTNIVRVIKSRMRWAGHVERMGEERGMYRVLVGKPEGKRPLGRPKRRWVDNIRKDLQEVRCGYVDWIGLAQDRDRWRTLVSTVMNLRVPWNAGNFLTSCTPVSFSRRTLHHGVSK